MTIQNHEIRLESNEHFNGRPPTHHLGYLLADLPIAIGGAVSMAIRNRSRSPGKQPKWLRKASDLRFAGHSGNGFTHLNFQLPSLQEAAPEVYSQQELFDTGRPNGNLTGLDLLMRVFSDIDNSRVDSNAFDSQLLRLVTRFKRFFARGPFSRFGISGCNQGAEDAVWVTQSTLENCNLLYGCTPTPQRVRLVGKLDGLEASTQRFSLVLDTGDRVAGVYPEEISDSLQKLWRQRVLVLGTSVFRASGNLLRIEADAIEDGSHASGLFSKTPIPANSRLDANRLRKPQGTRSGMAAIMGRWPGDETEAEIEMALELIS